MMAKPGRVIRYQHEWLGLDFVPLPESAVDLTDDDLAADDLWTAVSDHHTGTNASSTFARPDGLQVLSRTERTSAGIRIFTSLTAGATAIQVQRVQVVRLRLRSKPDHDPVIATYDGSRFLSNTFPPDDFAAHQRRLVPMFGDYTALSVHGGIDGRSASRDLPFLIVSGEPGIVVAPEWSGAWFLSAKQLTGSLKGHVDITAGLYGLDLTIDSTQSIDLPSFEVLSFQGTIQDGQNALRKYIADSVTPRLNGSVALPPAAFNTWAAMGNDYTAATMKPAVQTAAAVGLEYFVVDGGWHKGGFRQGIGNWTPDPDKFPSGIKQIAQYVTSQNMKFGLWLEPEYAHKNSQVVRDHPDWAVAAAARSVFSSPTLHQYDEWHGDYVALDFGNPSVQQYFVDYITYIYQEWGVRWLRWDSNQQPRPYWNSTSNPGAAQLSHIKGLYKVWDHLLETLPDLFIEQSATGGHRIDLGVLRRGHSLWMNDHTVHSDVVRRLQSRLQAVLPGNYPNTNLCQPRHDFTDREFLSHSLGGFGYSGRIWEASSAELLAYAHAWDQFKNFRSVMLGSYAAELCDPDDPLAPEEHRWERDGDSLRICFNSRGASVDWSVRAI